MKRREKVSTKKINISDLVAETPGPYRMTIQTDRMILMRVLELEGGTTEWSERVECGDLAGTIDTAELPEPTMLIWITGDGKSLSAARLSLDDAGRYEATVPSGHGRIHYATPETMEDTPPPDWPVLGEATVEPGGRTTFDWEN